MKKHKAKKVLSDSKVIATVPLNYYSILLLLQEHKIMKSSVENFVDNIWVYQFMTNELKRNLHMLWDAFDLRLRDEAHYQNNLYFN